MEQVVTTTRPCPSGRPEHMGVRVWRVAEWDMYRCRVCKHLWIDPIPTREELDAFYDQGYFHGDLSKRGYADYDRDKVSVAADFTRDLETLERYIPKGWLLDVGAATGFFVQLAIDRGWRGSGVELSEYASRMARERGLDVVHGTLEEHTERFRGVTAITMWDLVEHLREPYPFFEAVRRVISEDGIVMFATPRSDSLFARLLGKRWMLIAPPQHIHYFSLESVTHLLEQTGFKVIHHETHGKEFSISYIIHFMMGWLNINWGWLRRMTAWKPFNDLKFRINPRDSMVVIARPVPSTKPADVGRVSFTSWQHIS